MHDCNEWHTIRSCERIAAKKRGSRSTAGNRIRLTYFVFFADRLKVQLREQGARHDLVDAVFALEGQDDLVLIVRRVEALGKFLDTDDGKNLLAGYKRATNIIRIEEKKDARQYVGAPDPQYYRQDEEWALARAIDAAKAGGLRRRRQGGLRGRHDARWRSCARMSMRSSTR